MKMWYQKLGLPAKQAKKIRQAAAFVWKNGRYNHEASALLHRYTSDQVYYNSEYPRYEAAKQMAGRHLRRMVHTKTANQIGRDAARLGWAIARTGICPDWAKLK